MSAINSVGDKINNKSCSPGSAHVLCLSLFLSNLMFWVEYDICPYTVTDMHMIEIYLLFNEFSVLTVIFKEHVET